MLDKLPLELLELIINKLSYDQSKIILLSNKKLSTSSKIVHYNHPVNYQ